MPSPDRLATQGRQARLAIVQFERSGDPVGVGAGRLADGTDFRIQQRQAGFQGGRLVQDRLPLRGQLGDPSLEGRHRLGRRGDLVETGEAERVMPRLADGAGARVLRAGGRSFARKPVAGVETPEAVVAVDPAVGSR